MSSIMPLYQRLVGIAIVNLSHFEHFGYAQSAFFGAKLAIKHINASAELRGRKFCLPEYVEEEESITSRRHPHWEKLVKHGRKFVIGHTWSACQASETYAKKGILMISPTTDPRLTTRGHKLLFRTVGTSDQQASVACDWIVRNIKRGTRIAVLSDMQDKTAFAVRRGLKGKRKVVMVEEILPINYQDNSPTIRRMMQDRIDFVYYGGRGNTLLDLLRHARDESFKARFMGSDAGTKLDSAGELVERLVVASPGQFDDLEHHREMANCLQPEIASPSDFFLSYAAVQVLAQGIDAAGDCDDTDKIAQAIRSGTFDTRAGSMSFLPNEDLVSPEFVVEECHYGEEGRIKWTKA